MSQKTQSLYGKIRRVKPPRRVSAGGMDQPVRRPIIPNHTCPGEPGFECSDDYYAKGLCTRCYGRQWRRNNPEKIRQGRRRHYAKHGDRVRKKRLRYYAENRDEQREAFRRYYQETREKALEERRLWREANPEKMADYTRRRRARKHDNLSIPYTSEELTARLSMFGFRCWICGAPNADTIDHVIPVVRGGPECLSNLRPACMSCNQSKGTRHWSEFISGFPKTGNTPVTTKN